MVENHQKMLKKGQIKKEWSKIQISFSLSKEPVKVLISNFIRILFMSNFIDFCQKNHYDVMTQKMTTSVFRQLQQ